VKSQRGITLLEMIVATTILAIAVVGMMAGMSGTTRNAAKLQDYDRAVQLGRTKMNDLMLDKRIPRDALVSGDFDRSQSGGMQAGWKARITQFELPPVLSVGATALDRVELQVWWRTGTALRTYTLDAYRPRAVTAEDVAAGAPK
jgi:general secretion pathway protein I